MVTSFDMSYGFWKLLRFSSLCRLASDECFSYAIVQVYGLIHRDYIHIGCLCTFTSTYIYMYLHRDRRHITTERTYEIFFFFLQLSNMHVVFINHSQPFLNNMLLCGQKSKLGSRGFKAPLTTDILSQKLHFFLACICLCGGKKPTLTCRGCMMSFSFLTINDKICSYN